MKTFTERIYEKLRLVPSGKVTTYAELARALHSHAYRAVGTALKHNPDPHHTPCYKVVRSDGFVGFYSGPGGIQKKIQLLQSEGIHVHNRKINLKTYLFRFEK